MYIQARAIGLEFRAGVYGVEKHSSGAKARRWFWSIYGTTEVVHEKEAVFVGLEERGRGRPRDSRSGDRRYRFIFRESAKPVED